MAFSDSRYGNRASIVPPVILNLLIANVMLFFFQSFFHTVGQVPVLTKWLALWPLGITDLHRTYYGGADIQFWPWQLLTYGFLHGNYMHIFFNMFALWMFGREIEIEWGSRRFAQYYFACVLGAGLLQLIVMSLAVQNGQPPIPTIGASGGTYGILLAFGMMFPKRQIMLLFPPIPMEARWFVMIYGGIELFLGVSGLRTGVAHFAHLGGMLIGFLLIMWWKRTQRIRWW